MSERYVNLDEEIYYNVIDNKLLQHRRSKNVYWYSDSDIITAHYIHTYKELCKSQKLIETMENKIQHSKDNINHLIDVYHLCGKLISKFFIEPQIKRTEKFLNDEFIKSIKLKHELNQLINTEYIQKELKKYRENNPWPEGCI